MALSPPLSRAALNFTLGEGNAAKRSSGISDSRVGMSSNGSNGFLKPGANLDPTTPSDQTAPNSAVSGSSIDTSFTDLTGVTDEHQEGTDTQAPNEQIRTTALASRLRSPTEKSPELKIETKNAHRFSFQNLANEPQSVIHVPSGFGSFRGTAPPQTRPRSPPPDLSRHSAASEDPSPLPTDAASVSESFQNFSDTMSSNATTITALPGAAPVADEPIVVPQVQPPNQHMSTSTHNQQRRDSQPPSPPPISTQIAEASSERGTPRAQTRSEVSALSRPPSSLASIPEGDSPESNQDGGALSNDALDPLQRVSQFLHPNVNEIRALENALSECWTLCNTLAGLSSIHRERLFNFAGKGNMQENAWKACWKLCQNLYDNTEDSNGVYARPSLDLCRDFCLSLFEIRARDNETDDSVLRVCFELNNHLFNTHDRSLPDQFRERTLDFYITLCHRLMKQKARMEEGSDTLLRACWSLAEMLFSLRQSRRDNRSPDEELLGSAIQACWELCDIFREGWTQIRPERGTPRPSQTTFTQAFNQARRSVDLMQPEERPVRRFLPETPTTIFEDNLTNIISPAEVTHAPIAMANQQRRLVSEPATRHQDRHQEIPPSAITTHPPASIPSQDSPMSSTTFATDSSYASSNAGAPHPALRGRVPPALTFGPTPFMRNSIAPANTTVQRQVWPTYPSSTRSASAAPSETGVSLANTSTTRTTNRTGTTNRTATTRTTDTITRQNYAQSQEDPSLTLLKTLFVRAALQADRGYNPLSSDDKLSNLQTFARNLPADAFGNLSWQTSLMDNYKSAVAGDPGFGEVAASYLLQRSAGTGHMEVAKVVLRTVKNAYGFGWVRDLFRYVYGVYVEEVMQGVQPVNQQFLDPENEPGSHRGGPGSRGSGQIRSIKSNSGSLGGGRVRGATLAEKLVDQATGHGKHLDPVRPGESASATVAIGNEPIGNGGRDNSDGSREDS